MDRVVRRDGETWALQAKSRRRSNSLAGEACRMQLMYDLYVHVERDREQQGGRQQHAPVRRLQHQSVAQL